MSIDAKLAKQDGDDVSDTHADGQEKNILPNNGQEDPIHVANNYVGISCAGTHTVFRFDS